MAWQDKTFEAKYTSPSGQEFIFHYDSLVTRETELKTGIFQFPDRDGAHVQHQGPGTKSFPLTCIFSGTDCMEKADAFEKSLYEREAGELQHPAYGSIKVIPTGNIKREDDLVNALNESKVTITFTETITGEESKPMDAVSADAIENTLEELSESAALDFAENISVDTVADELALQSMLTTQVQLIDDNMIPLVESDTSALAKFKTISGELKGSIKSLKRSGVLGAINDIKNAAKIGENFVVKSLNTARMALNLMKLPNEIIVDITEKMKSYSTLTSNIINQFKNDPYGKKNIANAFHSTGLVLSACVASIASGAALSIAANAANSDKTVINRTPLLSAVSNQSTSDNSSIHDNPNGEAGDGRVESDNTKVLREESFQAINGILTLFAKTKAFQDSKIENNIVVDSNSNSYILLSELVYASVQLIMDSSLLLPMRRTITLVEDRQIIELVCELYGSVDFLDKFIADNDLSADELEVIPMGREVTYHVQVA